VAKINRYRSNATSSGNLEGERTGDKQKRGLPSEKERRGRGAHEGQAVDAGVQQKEKHKKGEEKEETI